MPIYDEENAVENILSEEKKGRLFITFNITFPKLINSDNKDEITKILEQFEN